MLASVAMEDRRLARVPGGSADIGEDVGSSPLYACSNSGSEGRFVMMEGE